MAIELGRINVNDLAENNYKSLGVGFGRKSNSNGIFAVNYTTLTQAKDNLVNLILTKKGEREMQPDFGCDIHNLIFEQIVEESIATDIENSILDAVNIWLPYINVDNIIFDLIIYPITLYPVQFNIAGAGGAGGVYCANTDILPDVPIK